MENTMTKNTFVRINADKILGIDKLEKITGETRTVISLSCRTAENKS